MRISDWSSDVCSSDLAKDDVIHLEERLHERLKRPFQMAHVDAAVDHQPFHLMEHRRVGGVGIRTIGAAGRSEEHTSELQSLMRISYAVFCLKKKKNENTLQNITLYNKEQLRINY